MILEIILAVMIFIMSLISIGLSVFYTFRIEKAYMANYKNKEK